MNPPTARVAARAMRALGVRVALVLATSWSSPDSDAIADAHASRRGDRTPQAELDVVLAAQPRECGQDGCVGAALVGVARGDDAARHRLDAAQQRAAGLDLAAGPGELLPRLDAAD